MMKNKEIEMKFTCSELVLSEIAKLEKPAPGYEWGETESLLITDTYFYT